jgi:hypothetical protein
MHSTTTSRTSEPEIALYRWRLGHQVFHLYLVAMITLLAELNDTNPPSDARTAVLLGDLAVLFEATAASMKYASNFDRDVYDSTIRPSMAPPRIKPGFSGSLNIDHKRMMASLVATPESLKRRFGEETSSWPTPVIEAWRSLVDAEQQARYHHGLVCRRLVTGGPSLLRMHMCGSGGANARGSGRRQATFTQADSA